MDLHENDKFMFCLIINKLGWALCIGRGMMWLFMFASTRGSWIICLLLLQNNLAFFPAVFVPLFPRLLFTAQAAERKRKYGVVLPLLGARIYEFVISNEIITATLALFSDFQFHISAQPWTAREKWRHFKSWKIFVISTSFRKLPSGKLRDKVTKVLQRVPRGGLICHLD